MSSHSSSFGSRDVNSRTYMHVKLVDHEYVESDNYTFYGQSVPVFKVEKKLTMYNSIYHNHRLMIIWRLDKSLFATIWDTSAKGLKNIELTDKIRNTLRNPGNTELKSIQGFENVMDGSFFLTVDMVLNENQHIKPITMIFNDTTPCWNMSAEDANTLIRKHNRLIIFRAADDKNKTKILNLRDEDVIICIWVNSENAASSGLYYGEVNFIPYNINIPLSNFPLIMKGRQIYGVNDNHDALFVGGLRMTRRTRVYRKRTQCNRIHRKRTYRK